MSKCHIKKVDNAAENDCTEQHCVQMLYREIIDLLQCHCLPEGGSEAVKKHSCDLDLAFSR